MGDKGQAMFLDNQNKEDLKQIQLDEFEVSLMKLIKKDVQPERLNPEELYIEFGCSMPIRFNTSEGIKRIEPGKVYDSNLNEI